MTFQTRVIQMSSSPEDSHFSVKVIQNNLHEIANYMYGLEQDLHFQHKRALLAEKKLEILGVTSPEVHVNHRHVTAFPYKSLDSNDTYVTSQLQKFKTDYPVATLRKDVQEALALLLDSSESYDAGCALLLKALGPKKNKDE